jgi:hypothetical protein
MFLALFLTRPHAPSSVAVHDEYPGYDTMMAEVRAIATQHPDRVTLVEYGRSVQGRPLVALRIALNDGVKRPEALVAGNIHGNEWIGNRLAVSVAQRLANDADTDPWVGSLLKRIDFYVIPCINPDGYVATEEERGKPRTGRKIRHNANGVDLNRNFPLPATRTIQIAMAGSTDKDSAFYGGEAPYSEPETRAVRDFVAAHHFFADIDFHSAWGTIFPPKCPDNRCVKLFREMFKPAIARQRRPYQLIMFPQGDTYTGEMEDTLYYDYGILAVCWEISFEADGRDAFKLTKDWFYEQNPIHVADWVENDRDAALAAIEKALELTGGNPVGPELRKAK